MTDKDEILVKNKRVASLEKQLNVWKSKAAKFEIQVNKLTAQLEELYGKQAAQAEKSTTAWTVQKKDGAYQAIEFKIFQKRVVGMKEYEPNAFPIVKHQVAVAWMQEMQKEEE